MEHPMAHGRVMRRPLYEALTAIRALFSDTTVNQQETYRDLTELEEEIAVMKDSLKV